MAKGVKSLIMTKGHYFDKSSIVAKSMVITPDEKAVIEVKEWLPGTTAQDKTKNLTWFLFDAKKKLIRKEAGITYGITIPKSLCGSYTYYIDASLSGKSEFKSGIYIRGRCDQKIKTSKWCTQNDGADVRKTYTFSYGHIIHLNLETEGMNGDSVYVDIFRRVKGGGGTKDDQHIHTYTDVKVIDGEINLQIGNTYLWYARIGKPGSQEEFYVKIKAGGKYITDGKDHIHARFLRIKNTIVSKAVEPSQSNTPAKVGNTNKTISSIGLISLEKIAVNTTYDVCNDELNNFSDFKNFWILEDKGKYYHWLKKRTNPLDTAKPNPIPVTITSLDKFIFYATFKAIFPIDNLSIRAKDKANKYVFQSVPITKQTKGQEFVVKFVSDNAPYANTVEYFSNFALTFECSIDGKSWISCGNSQFCLYVTWKEPLWGSFESNPIESYSMKITNTATNKKNISETQLWIGCQNGKGKGKNEEEIADYIFEAFKAPRLLVTRRRETEGLLSKNLKTVGLGYWRGASRYPAPPSVQTSDFGANRSTKYLLSNGEARCGEWDSFLQHILLCHGIISGSLPFESKGGGINSEIFLVKSTSGWDLRDPKAPKERLPHGNKAQGNTAPMHFFWDHVFTILKTPTGFKYYDASYGVKSSSKFSDAKSLLKIYSSLGLNGVVYLKSFIGTTAVEPEHHFKFDLHVKQDIFGTPNNYDIKTINMQDHLKY